MSPRPLLLALSALSFAVSAARADTAPIEIQWWHAMTSANADKVAQIADGFNTQQTAYKVVPVYKGSYAETLNAGIAAFRAGTQPAILQVFEVGTATMMAAKGAIKPVYQLMADAKEPFDPAAYLPAVTGYYSTTDGKMLSLPFNSSTPIVYYNKDAFTKAGLDPNKPPKTWPEFFDDAKKIRASGSPCGFTAGWISWTQLESFGAWHNLPFASKANGLGGTDAELAFNGPLQVKHIQTLAELQKDKTFDYGGRTSEPEAKFISGDCGMIQTSSGFYGNVKANAKFAWGMAELPYYPDVQGAPQNSIIGGASLWVMGGKKPEDYVGVAKFFTYLSQTALQKDLHEVTGYLPITKAAYDAIKADGFYAQNPEREIPVLQMSGRAPTDNSRGLRLGNLVQIRDVIAEELEATFAGKETAKEALDKAKARGDVILRNFQKSAS
ncbi:MAG TPA: sn-glycerol-3-phosphate ABC transporter substrate-binding protein UgpB [Stellaceae bacterium]|nr:sn-glycerol-3-phosphate ABC transporter substrate-binding protein UgpB [Stellaceae bacterium]